MSQRWRQFWCTNVQTCRGKLSLFPFWYFVCSVLIRLCPPFLSRNQLSRHSMLPQPPHPHPDGRLSYSLSFSCPLIPLTMHIPKTDLHLWYTPPLPTTSFPNPSLAPQVPVQVHHVSLLLHPLTINPTPLNHIRPRWNVDAYVSRGSLPSRTLWWYKTLSVQAFICSFCQYS